MPHQNYSSATSTGLSELAQKSRGVLRKINRAVKSAKKYNLTLTYPHDLDLDCAAVLAFRIHRARPGAELGFV